MTSCPPQVTDRHLHRDAFVYIRQSSILQVREHTGSTALQRELGAEFIEWGWPAERVHVLDEDLGVSGSIPGLRPGFESLLRLMEAEQVGVVAVSDISRLTRNAEDLVRFARVARTHDVLLIHSGQTINFNNPNDEFIGCFMGLNAVRENRARAEMGARARRKKAEQGKATTTPPIGYVKLPGGLWGKDPDPAVRETIERIFDLFEQLGSVRKVTRRLRVEGFTFNGKQGRPIMPTTVRIYRILRHPAYTGRYIFGLTTVRQTGGAPRRVPGSSADRIIHDDHHDAYLSLGRWTRIQEQLTANRASLRPAAGRGAALVQGIIRCTKHGSTMHTVYRARQRSADGTTRRVPAYTCRPGTLTGENGVCFTVTAARVDALVEQELLRLLTPPSVSVIEEAIRDVRQEYEVQKRQRETTEARAEQEVTTIERLLRETPAAHVHARYRLFPKFEAAAAALEEVKARHRLTPLASPVSLEARDLTDLRELLNDLDRLWHHPCVTVDQRKMLIRTAIKTIYVTPGPVVPIQVEWIGGAMTHLELAPYTHGHTVVSELYNAGRTDPQIVDELRHRGLVIRKGLAAGKPYTRSTIRHIVQRLGLQRSFDEQAYALIRSRITEGGVSHAKIVVELNEAGIRTRQGRWTLEAVKHAVTNLRAGQVPGLPEVPRSVPIKLRVLALAEKKLDPEAIAAQLDAEGCVTRFRRPVTAAAVRVLLRRAGKGQPS